MNTKPNTIYKPKKGIDYYVVIVFGIGCIFLACFLFIHTFKDKYPQFGGLLIASLSGLFGAFVLYSFLNQKTIYVFDDFIELKSSLFSRKIKILKSDIISWSEMNISSRKKSKNVFYIFTDLKKYSFDSAIYNNYDNLKTDFTKNSVQNTEYEESWNSKLKRKIAVGLSITGVLILFFLFKNCTKTDQISELSNYKQIEQIVTSKIKITKSSKGHESIELKFKEYPEFTFYMDGSAYKITKSEEFVNNIKTGDTLKLYISSEDYQKKISKQTKLTFYDTFFGYYRVDVFGLTKNNYDYLKIDNCIKEVKWDKDSNFWFLFIVGILLLNVGISSYANNQY